MTDKSIQELALSVERPVEKLLEQVREAGLPQRRPRRDLGSGPGKRQAPAVRHGPAQPQRTGLGAAQQRLVDSSQRT